MIERLFRVLFWIALVVCFVMAVIPVTIDTHTSDKTQHMAAFALLTALALAGYRETKPSILFVGLAAFGGLIELVQGLPIVSRDSDLVDWGADLLAVAFVLAIAWATRGFARGTSSKA